MAFFNGNHIDSLDDITGPTGMYQIYSPEHNYSFPIYVDQEYDGGGWVCVMANRRYTAGMNNLAYNDAVNRANYRTNGTDDATNDVFTPTTSTGIADFNCWVGLKFWEFLAKRKDPSNITVAQYTANSIVNLGDTSNHTNRAQWKFSSFNTTTWTFNSPSAYTNATGSIGSSGMYTYHASRPLTAYDSDNDENAGNCATYYNNNPWWYGSCWNGNYFAGGGHVDGPYWNGSGPYNYAYGAIYIK